MLHRTFLADSAQCIYYTVASDWLSAPFSPCAPRTLLRVSLLMRYACLELTCGSTTASSAPCFTQRRTVVSSTRRIRATSETVKRSLISFLLLFFGHHRGNQG